MADFADISGVGETVRDAGETAGEIVRPEHARAATIWLLQSLQVSNAEILEDVLTRHPDLRTLAEDTRISVPGQRPLIHPPARMTSTPTPSTVPPPDIQPRVATITATPAQARGTPQPPR
jgi:hypothetical protein